MLPSPRPPGRCALSSLVAAALLVTGSSVARAEPLGALSQLSGAYGCLSEGGAEGCATGKALRGAASVAVSPDGRNVYVAANNAGSISIFRRARNGVISPAGCVSAGGLGGCASARGLLGAFGVAVSPDGRNVYAATFGGVAVFARRPAGGALEQLDGAGGCVNRRAEEGCGPGRALASAAGVTLSPDGRNVYVASVGSNAVAIFRRDPRNGTISQLPGADGCVAEGGTEDCSAGRALEGAFSIALSPDGRHAYVAASESSALAVFERDPDDGALIQLDGPDACVNAGGASGCAAGGRGLGSANGVVVAPDGRNVYVASSGSRAVAAFSRDSGLGTVNQLPGALGCTSQGGVEGCATGRALTGAFSLAMSLDAANAYAVSSTSIVSFLRNRSNGALTQLTSPDACTSEGGLENCLTGRGLREASGTAVSPDGRNVYVASYASNAVATFARSPQPAGLEIRVAGIPRRCARRVLRARVRVRSNLPVRRIRVYLDRRRLGSRSAVRRLTVRISPRRLARGRHRLRFDAADVGGSRKRRAVGFRRCAH